MVKTQVSPTGIWLMVLCGWKCDILSTFHILLSPSVYLLLLPLYSGLTASRICGASLCRSSNEILNMIPERINIPNIPARCSTNPVPEIRFSAWPCVGDQIKVASTYINRLTVLQSERDDLSECILGYAFAIEMLVWSLVERVSSCRLVIPSERPWNESSKTSIHTCLSNLVWESCVKWQSYFKIENRVFRIRADERQKSSLSTRPRETHRRRLVV